MFSTWVERVRRLLAVNSQTFEELGLLFFFLYNKYILIDEEEIDNPKIKEKKMKIKTKRNMNKLDFIFKFCVLILK